MTSHADFVRPPTAQAAVLDELRRRISAGSLRPGSPLSQDQLAQELGVSRNPIREALRVLEGEGQVVHESHRGYFVAELGLGALTEIYRMRELLESEALRVAVPDLADHVVADMRAAVTEMQRAEETTHLVEANRRFHFAAFEASDMPHLVKHIRMLWAASDAYRAHYYLHLEGALTHVHTEHDDILAAVESRDADAAVAAARAHRERAIAALTSVLAGAEPR